MIYKYTNAFNLHNNPNKVDTLIISTLQMKKPSHRERLRNLLQVIQLEVAESD